MKKPFGPDYYAQYKIQPWDFCLINGLGHAESCVIKYICRWKYKDGEKDLLKAVDYIRKILEVSGSDVVIEVTRRKNKNAKSDKRKRSGTTAISSRVV